MAVVQQQVQPFNRSMIEKCLRSTSWRFLTDSEGDFVVEFRYDEETGVELEIFFEAEGSKGQIYVIRGHADKRIPKNDWNKALMVCNTWNKEKRWPKAYLYVRDPSTDTTGTIMLEENLDLETGIHQELLNDITLTAVAGMFGFWEWAHREQGL